MPSGLVREVQIQIKYNIFILYNSAFYNGSQYEMFLYFTVNNAWRV